VRRPQDTPHPRRSRGTLSHDRVGKVAGGEEAVACRDTIYAALCGNGC